MVDREIAPLKTLEELLNFQEPLQECSVQPLRRMKRGKPEDPKILFCHDMMGGYLEDRFVYGSMKPDSYRFHHWQQIDSFVYFSHHMVTIPPLGWISAGHKHGVKVLGTFIVESDPGKKILEEMKEGDLVSKAASQLALVAEKYCFDGWLINIESEMDATFGPFFTEFLKAVTEETHKSVPGSLVIWYDSVLQDGKLSWQNELNAKNSHFFDLCDGIFLNYGWTEQMLESSATLAGDRKSDVYVGIDVFARNTKYAGGFETCKAVEQAHKHGLSAAIFAAGWVFETQDQKQFVENQYRFWDFPQHCCPEWRVTSLPISTSFCQGYGKRLYERGEVVAEVPWFNLSAQQLQPRDQGLSLCNGCASATVYTEEAFNGGGCLNLKFTPSKENGGVRGYFRLFGCDLPLGRITVSYTFKPLPGFTTIPHDTAVVLKTRDAEGGEHELLLGACPIVPKESGYKVKRDIDDRDDQWGDAKAVRDESSWITRKYTVEEPEGTSGSGVMLEEVGACFVNATVPNSCLLGELIVKRPDVKVIRDDRSHSSNEGLDYLSEGDASGGEGDSTAEPRDKRSKVGDNTTG